MRRNEKIALYKDGEKFLQILLVRVLTKVWYLQYVLFIPHINVPTAHTFPMKRLYFFTFKSFPVYSLCRFLLFK